MVKISLWMSDGCLSSAVTALMDAFTIANLCYRHLSGTADSDLFEARIVSTDGRAVNAQGNIVIQPHMSIHDVDHADCLVISPVLPNIHSMPRDIHLLGEWIKQVRKKDTIIASVCTGTFVLAQLGLLDGKKATTNWQFARMFKKQYPRVCLVAEDMLTEDDNIICTGAATAVNNLAIYLIRRYGSHQLADACSKALLIDPNRHNQVPYIMSIPFRTHGDEQVLKAQDIIEKLYDKIETIDDVARDVGISPRHFKRRFKKATGDLPLKYLQKVRIDAAKLRLETTRETIDKITWAVGYKDISSFCRLFKQHTRISPKIYREKFFSRVQ